MSQELDQVGTGIEQPSGGKAPVQERPSTPTGGAELTPDLKAQIEAAVTAKEQEWQERAKAEAQKIQSAKDKELATLRRQLRTATQKRVDEAKALLGSNPDQAASLLLGLAEEQSQQIEQEGAHDELVTWQHKILTDLGADPEKDEGAAALAAEWGPKILQDPNMTWDFQQAAAQLQLGREREARKEAAKELQELRDSLPDVVKAEVTRALTSAGLAPMPTEEGGTPGSSEEWRDLPISQLKKQGLEARRKRPIKRT